MKNKFFIALALSLFIGVAGVQVSKHTNNQVQLSFISQAQADDTAAPAVEAPAEAPAAPEVGVTDEIPSWIAPVVMWLQGVPTVGPILVEVLKWLGLLAAVLTALSTFMMALSKAVVGVAGMAGFVAFAEKAQKFFDVALKYAKYFSMFNVQKK